MASPSYAKINLYLKIGKKLSSGYHNIQSVMQRIELSDSVTIEPLNEDRISVESTHPELSSEENLAYKAAVILKKKYKVKQGARIHIEKNIPLQSGLGGGSSNAATTILNLNKLWGLKLKEKQLIELAMQIGSDVPFFIGENAAVVEGIGDKIRRIKKSFSINIVLINPGFRASTKWAYSAFDRQKPKIKSKADMNSLVKAIEKKDIKEIANNLHNDFEPIVTKKYKVINEIKTNLLRNDALNALVSGSGPTVFGVFNSIYEAREAFFKIQYDYPFVFLTKTI
ncbi:4-(cytidine 5'-diphospho)-2-C-methyl-D-erythritol kinase [Candidatus Woesearchaeota archaeon]|nr:4-(cytidine 5'-diphospho)-2-C-methyl-D-erythritol kinase [Candidatus Woesearchaeota archaeon]